MVRRTRARLTLAGVQQITLDGQTLFCTVKRSRRARHVRLEVQVGSGVTVVIPWYYELDQIPDLLQDKGHWILSKLTECRQLQLSFAGRSGEGIYYLGQKLKLLKQQNHNEADSVILERNRFIVGLRPTSTLNRILEGWYRQQAKRLIRERVEKLSARLQVTYHKVNIRSARTRWASCSQKGNLNFNWKLIMAPDSVIDYVIIHELAHLIEMNHSKRFWTLVEEYCPEWREHKAWLRNHQVELARSLSE